MANLIKCKACGYVTGEGKIKDVCPACGVPEKMFEPYTDTIAEKRRRILRLHIHPIIVHFPQSFVFTLFVLAVLSFVVPPKISEFLFCTIQLISSALPLILILALLTGLVDGKTRFRRVTTPFLKKKIIFGLSFLFTSILIAATAFALPLSSVSVMALFTMLTIIAVGFSIALGLIGDELLDAKLPG
ncbi:MAG TPA: rubrerythrin [Smithella sp.]|jgi:ribosomal protein L37E|nr:rubrerythrin [Smithella sp.]